METDKISLGKNQLTSLPEGKKINMLDCAHLYYKRKKPKHIVYIIKIL